MAVVVPENPAGAPTLARPDEERSRNVRGEGQIDAGHAGIDIVDFDHLHRDRVAFIDGEGRTGHRVDRRVVLRIDLDGGGRRGRAAFGVSHRDFELLRGAGRVFIRG